MCGMVVGHDEEDVGTLHDASWVRTAGSADASLPMVSEPHD